MHIDIDRIVDCTKSFCTCIITQAQMSEPSRDIPRPPKIPREETPTASESENADSEESDSKLRHTEDMTEDARDKVSARKVEKMLFGRTAVWGASDTDLYQ